MSAAGQVPALRPSRREVAGVVAAWLLFLAVNLYTADIFPTVGYDEPTYADPAVNLYRGQGFTSSAWPGARRDQFFAAQPPLYQFLLFLWLRLFGFSLLAVRSLNVVLGTAAAAMLWWGCLRWGLLRQAGQRGLWLAALFSGGAVIPAICGGRPEALLILLTALVLVAASWPRPGRDLAMVLLGAAAISAGLQLPVYFLLLLLLCRWFIPGFGAPGWPALLAGFALGFGGLALLYLWQGQLLQFFASTFASGHTLLGHLVQAVHYHDSRVWQRLLLKTDDYLDLPSRTFGQTGFTLFFLAAVFLVWRTKTASPGHGAARLALAASLILPLSLLTLGKYPIYYTWMTYLPLVTAALVAYERSRPDLSAAARRGLLILFILAALAGWPWHTALALASRSQRQYHIVEACVQLNLRPGEAALVNPAAYYAAKPLAGQLYLSGYSSGRLYPRMDQKERQSISFLLLDPAEFPVILDKVGGAWQPSGPLCGGLPPGRFFTRHFRVGLYQLHHFYSLQPYRRVEPGAPAVLDPEKDK